MDKSEIVQSISDNYLKLSNDCTEDLVRCIRVLALTKDDMVVREGQFSDKVYFIFEGCARAYYLKDGKDITEWFAFENEFISAINSFYAEVPSQHNIEVMTDSILVEITKEKVQELSDKHWEFDKLEKMILTQTLLQLQQRLISIQFESARQKYENLLNLRPDIIHKVPLTHIASYLGITLETLSRIRNPKSGI